MLMCVCVCVSVSVCVFYMSPFLFGPAPPSPRMEKKKGKIQTTASNQAYQPLGPSEPWFSVISAKAKWCFGDYRKQ